MKAATRLQRLDQSIFQVERQGVAALFLAMGGATFLYVLHRIFSRSPGRFSILASRLFSDGSLESATRLDQFALPTATAGAFFLIARGAYQTRAGRGGPKSHLWLRSLAVALSIYAGAWVYVRWVPQGMVWAPYFGLTCLLWIGLLGASMATHSGQHLALEMGEKIWPERFRPHVKRVAAAIVGLLTLALCLLGVLSVVDHYRDWASGPGAGLIPSIDWPKWAVFLVVPYSFGMMALRNFARAAGLLPEPKPSEVPH